MSGWDAYITSLTGGSNAIRRAAIVGLNDGTVWARTDGDNAFRATEAELKKFVGYFRDETSMKAVPASGADLENVHYIVPRTEEALMFGKKDKSGFFAAKTKSAVLIAVYEGENMVASDVRTAIEKLADYLQSLNY